MSDRYRWISHADAAGFLVIPEEFASLLATDSPWRPSLK